MALAVVLSPRALADLETIRAHIAADNPERADTFVDELYEATRALAVSGPRYAIVPRYRLLQIRSVSHRRYLIFYQITGDTVGILRIVHGARDLANLFG